MRSLAFAILLALAIPAALAFAQSSTNNNAQNQNVSVSSAHHNRGDAKPRYNAKAHYEDESDGVCYTMRTYYFERQDGNAPVPSGMTTCTRISQRDLKRADRDVTPRLIPATR